MATELFANNPATTLSGGINSAVTTLTVVSSTGFPAAATGVSQFRVIIGSELLIVTNVSGATWTVTRGAESTVAAAHLNGDAVTHVVTAASVNSLGPHAVTPEAFGAAGDGAADDTAELQAAVTAAVAQGRPLELSGRYVTSSSIVLPTGVPITIRAAVTDVNPFGSLSANVAAIESSGSAVFTAADAVAVKLNMTGINFRNTGGGTTSLFDTVNFSESRISQITTANYNYIFKGGTVGGVTIIKDSYFLSVKTVFASAGMVDAVIKGNYISGSVATNSTVFTGPWAHSLFQGNYVDFWKRVFNLPNGDMDGVRVVGNIFDYCWNIVGTSTAAFQTRFIFTGNDISHCTAALGVPQFSAPDADMTGTPWRAIDASDGINRSTFTGNAFYDTDLAFRIAGGVGALRESGNTFVDTTPSAKFDFQPGFYTAQDVYLESHAEGRFTQTFAAALTVNFKAGALAQVTLTANITSLAFSNAPSGCVVEVQFIQDGTGSRTLASPSASIKWAGTAPTLSTGASKRDVFRFRYDGTNFYEISRAMNVG
jgi:hypothetical protein